MGLVALFACWSVVTPDAHAQVLNNDQTDEPVVLIPVTEQIGLADLPSTDLSGMSAKWWKDLRKEHTRLLGSSDEHVIERVMQNIVFFAEAYRDHVDFKRAVPKLYYKNHGAS